MKSEINQSEKNNQFNKNNKPLLEKKSPNPIFKKEKNQINLNSLNENFEIHLVTTQKFASPKVSKIPLNSNLKQTNDELSKQQKFESKKIPEKNKPAKLGVGKQDQIKKENPSTLKSPKNPKVLIVQSNLQGSDKRDYFSNLCESRNQTEVQVDQNLNSLKNSVSNHNQIDQKTINEQKKQIQRLQQLNEQLQNKIQKLQQSQQQNRKKLKERISSFNEEGHQIMSLKNKIVELQNALKLDRQNQISKKESSVDFQTQTSPTEFTVESVTPPVEIAAEPLVKTSVQCQTFQENEINQLSQALIEISNLDYKFQMYSAQILPIAIMNPQNPKKLMVDTSVMASFDELSEDGLSFINGSGTFSNFDESSLSIQKNHLNEMPCEQILAIKIDYEKKFQEKFNALESLANQTTKNIQNRYKLLVAETVDIVQNQQRQLAALQNEINQLYEKLEDCTCNGKIRRQTPRIDACEEKLKYMMEVNQYEKKLSKKEEELKQLRQQIHMKQIQCKKLISELDIQRIKFNLCSQIGLVSKHIAEIAENQALGVLAEELRQQKQKNLNLIAQNQKKKQLIRKMSAYHSAKSHNKTPKK